jgi:hypothetical protein
VHAWVGTLWGSQLSGGSPPCRTRVGTQSARAPARPAAVLHGQPPHELHHRTHHHLPPQRCATLVALLSLDRSPPTRGLQRSRRAQRPAMGRFHPRR